MKKSDVTIETLITIYDWSDEARPELRIEPENNFVCVSIGGSEWFDIASEDRGDFIAQLEGWRDIFDAAVKVLKQDQRQDETRGEKHENELKSVTSKNY